MSVRDATTIQGRKILGPVHHIFRSQMLTILAGLECFPKSGLLVSTRAIISESWGGLAGALSRGGLWLTLICLG